ncbi:GDSL esterase/lipase At1g29670-like [Salvia hispanica]|uniref:GDSL esterase/lipase At1g29670-like n=1 Tax=Salvia hispanica TaxID=49212 RepID=UPI002009938D|nr:GDSL esterase/lipase At1g29670-like [Salvia hispanica]
MFRHTIIIITMPHSIMRNLFYFLLLNLVIFQFGGVVSASQVHCFFIFGDSLVDNGNNNYLNTTAKVNYSPYGIDFPAGPTGRFTNGRNTADFLAELLEIDEPLPPYAIATDWDKVNGVNFGSGGAGILDESGQHFGDVLTMSDQVSNHEAILRDASEKVGIKLSLQHLSNCTYYVGMGSNDYLGNYLPKYYASTTQYTPEQFASLAIAQYSKHLRRLYKNGGRKVAVNGLGRLGCVPQQTAKYPVSPLTGCVETSNAAVDIFNEKLKKLIKSLNLLPDARFLYVSEITDNPSYGNITVVGKPCCEVSEDSLGHCVEGSTPCSNRDEYYFWDSFHPTEAAASLSAKIIYDAMAPLLQTTTAAAATPLVDIA